MPEASEGRYRVADLSALEDEDPRTVRVASFDDLGDPDGGTDGGDTSGAADGASPAVLGIDRRRVADFRAAEDGEARPAGPGSNGTAGRTVTVPAGNAPDAEDDGPVGPLRVASFGGPRTDDTRVDDGDGSGEPRVASFDGTAASTRGRSRRRDTSRRNGATATRTRGAGRGGRADGATAEERPATPAEQQARAKEICLRLLTDRARTVKELRDAMIRKEIPEDVADGVLERFDEVGLVDDAAFAELWVRSRHQYRGLGKRAIAVELRRKGVDSETAAEALTGIDDDAERGRARELVSRRLRGLPIGSGDERQSTARKLVGMLARKGYGPNVAYAVVREEIAAAGADAEEFGEEPPDEQ